MRLRGLLAAAVLSAAACGRGAPGSGPACPHDPALGRAVDVEVVVSSYTTAVRRDLSLEELARLPGTETVGPGGKLQGLTVVAHRTRENSDIALSGSWLGGAECAWISKLTVDLTPARSEIYVPSEYADDSCEYEQILAHERTHDETDRDALAEAAENLRAALRRADWLPARGTPLAVSGRAEAERRIGAMADKAAAPELARFEEELARRQAVIDLPENYRWTSSRCSNWK
jgi:hypothetical protein